MAFELPELPYAYDALEPYISATTLELHHGKHHDAYLEKLNEAVAETELADLTLEEIIQKTADDSGRRHIFNNAAQSWNHSFFWDCIAPDGGAQPDGELARQIDRDFGSFGKFREAFLWAAKNQFGSGWAWLVLDGGRLTVTATPNAVPPMVHGQQALLTCDVWEHAYYLDYQNRRGEFVMTFLDNLVNWPFVARQFALQGEGASAAGRRYQEEQRGFARSGRVPRAAEAAGEAVVGDEASELERARAETAKGVVRDR